MSLDSYSALQTSIGSWLRRSDLTATIPDFISLAEAQFNRRLRVRQMVTRKTVTIGAEYVTAPTDFAGVRTFSIPSTPPVALQYLDQDQLETMTSRVWPDGATRYYTVVGTEFRFFPAPTTATAADLTYWAKVPALSNSNTSNWLLQTSPDIYLYGALLQSAPYLRADDRIATWAALYRAAMEDLQSADSFDAMGAVLTPIPTITV